MSLEILNIPAPIVELIDTINKDNNPTFSFSSVFIFTIFNISKLILKNLLKNNKKF